MRRRSCGGQRSRKKSCMCVTVLRENSHKDEKTVKGRPGRAGSENMQSQEKRSKFGNILMGKKMCEILVGEFKQATITIKSNISMGVHFLTVHQKKVAVIWFVEKLRIVIFNYNIKKQSRKSPITLTYRE